MKTRINEQPKLFHKTKKKVFLRCANIAIIDAENRNKNPLVNFPFLHFCEKRVELEAKNPKDCQEKSPLGKKSGYIFQLIEQS